MRKIDNFVVGVLLILIAASPLAFGSVHPWAYRPLEAVLFALGVFWMVKIFALADSGSTSGERSDTRAIAIPFIIFVALVVFQMTPLPPAGGARPVAEHL